ncbi:MAG TPA: hypothetical protein VG388_05600 [Solirubrobacteraceae bacterium]|nr:hypothetical protein [Solirubrobacteraceae bacterium]
MPPGALRGAVLAAFAPAGARLRAGAEARLRAGAEAGVRAGAEAGVRAGDEAGVRAGVEAGVEAGVVVTLTRLALAEAVAFLAAGGGFESPSTSW